MNKRENLLRSMRRQGFEEVPVSISLCKSQQDEFERRYGHRNVEDHYGIPLRMIGAKREPRDTDWRRYYVSEDLPSDAWFDNFGVGHSKGSDAAFHMTRMHHPLKGERGLQEIEEYPLPDIPAGELERISDTVADIQRRELAAIGGLACTIWEKAWYIRGMEDLMMDIMSDDPKAAVHLDKITDLSVKRAEMLARAGVDVLHTGDDIGMQNGPMMSLEMWSSALKPRLARVIRAAREIKPDILISYHSCGHVLPFIEGLIEAGVDILNPIQPEADMDFARIHAEYGGRLSFWGTIGTQTTMPFGSAEDVRNEVNTNLEVCGSQGGLLLSPTHLVEPEVPWANIEALFDAAARFRGPGHTRDKTRTAPGKA